MKREAQVMFGESRKILQKVDIVLGAEELKREDFDVLMDSLDRVKAMVKLAQMFEHDIG